MKFKYLFLTLLFSGFLLALPKFQTAYARGCLTRTVTFNASSWSQGPITVQCYGDSHPINCPGDTVTLSPGETKNLNHCSCDIFPGDAPDGCLHIISTPNTCNASIQGGQQSSCGQNGDSISSNITGSCQIPASPIPTRVPVINLLDAGGSCVGPTPVASLTWNESPARPGSTYEIDYCTSGCDFIGNFRSAGTSTTNFWQGNISLQNTSYFWIVKNLTQNTNSGIIETTSKTCTTTTLNPSITLPPTPTLTPTPTPTPSTVPSGPPVTSPPGAPSATSTPRPSATLTPRPASPTPTSTPFSPDMCKCDGIDTTPIFPGASVSLNAFAKVLGTNTNFAKVKDITFKVYESTASKPNDASIITQSGPISSQEISRNSSAVRYKSSWNFIFPSSVNSTSLYRITAQINCVKKVAMAPSNILGAETARPSFLQSLFAFLSKPFEVIGGLFGGGSSELLSSPSQQSVPTQTSSQKKGLQLKTIYPAEIVENDFCSYIKFKFNNQ